MHITEYVSMFALKENNIKKKKNGTLYRLTDCTNEKEAILLVGKSHYVRLNVYRYLHGVYRIET